MIDLGDLMADPDFAASYQIKRMHRVWHKGRVVEKSEILNFYGPVQPARSKELAQFPEGDREKGLMKFLCAPPYEIHITQEQSSTDGDESYISDIAVYKGELFKIIQVSPWQRHGYQRAFGYRIGRVTDNG